MWTNSRPRSPTLRLTSTRTRSRPRSSRSALRCRRERILADEVGLGKTIEAGILLAQHWAERRRTLLVICPANLRKQWSQELLDKFFLQKSVILEAKTFNEAIRAGNLNPFAATQRSSFVPSSFARSKEP